MSHGGGMHWGARRTGRRSRGRHSATCSKPRRRSGRAPRTSCLAGRLRTAGSRSGHQRRDNRRAYAKWCRSNRAGGTRMLWWPVMAYGRSQSRAILRAKKSGCFSSGCGCDCDQRCRVRFGDARISSDAARDRGRKKGRWVSQAGFGCQRISPTARIARNTTRNNSHSKNRLPRCMSSCECSRRSPRTTSAFAHDPGSRDLRTG